MSQSEKINKLLEETAAPAVALAAAIGCSPSHLSRVRKGEGATLPETSLEKFNKLAELPPAKVKVKLRVAQKRLTGKRKDDVSPARPRGQKRKTTRLSPRLREVKVILDFHDKFPEVLGKEETLAAVYKLLK